MTDPTQTRLLELFEFDAAVGVLIWRERPTDHFASVGAWKTWNKRYSGSVAGNINGDGYRQIRIDGARWLAHRLIWIYANGPIPAGMQIDHLNGVRDDNRLQNFRLVTNAENGRNQSMPRNNTSGVIGVGWHKLARKWRAMIMIDGRTKYLGLFDTVADAAAARAKAERDFRFHPGHGKAVAFAISAASEPRP